MVVLVIFNGPPRAGKDAAVAALAEVPHSVHHTFKAALVEATQRTYKVPPEMWDAWYTTTGKEEPRSALQGKSCRQALIHISEHVFKMVIGQDVWADQFVQRCPTLASDGGFAAEVAAAAKHFTHVHVCRLIRPGTSFAGDSRDYLYPSDDAAWANVTFHDLGNYSTLAAWQAQVQAWFATCVGGLGLEEE